ncbi:GntR family transcriptional regulator [Embleya hyalina]|uniref:GntR family transcriptional regulator n=1 Tax=Embleya hyalina TaxID=516124 RepID=A0A401Z1P3_9ACTN|nr:GntR family transcriptional regulator [Embleya hyalina]GCE00752.1 GntR family transcriptional regulator [Embleya hyalina]
MVSHSSPIPLYHQIASILRQQILDGVYPPEHQLAPENDLAKQFGVSRATVRQAVLELADAGLLARRHGRGTFVLDAARKPLRYRFHGDMHDLLTAAAANAHTVREMSLHHRRELPPTVARDLHVADGRGTIVERLMDAADAPFAYHRNYLPDAYGRLLSRRRLKSVGVLHLLNESGVPLVRARQTILARAAEPDIADRLDVGHGGVVLYTERVVRTEDGTPVELAHSWYPAGSYGYTVDFDTIPHAETP